MSNRVFIRAQARSVTVTAYPAPTMNRVHRHLHRPTHGFIWGLPIWRPCWWCRVMHWYRVAP